MSKSKHITVQVRIPISHGEYITIHDDKLILMDGDAITIDLRDQAWVVAGQSSGRPHFFVWKDHIYAVGKKLTGEELVQ